MTTIEHTYLKEEELIRRAIRALIKDLGPVEALRFLSLPREYRIDSIQRHREWQAALDAETFYDQVFT